MIYKFANYLSKIYNYAIAMVRRESGSVTMGFAIALVNYMFQFVMVMSMMVFMRGSLGIGIRGEFGLYIMTGVGLYMLHNKFLSEISSSRTDKNLMPLLAISPGIMIMGKILHTLYMQVMIMLLFCAGVWVYYGGFQIEYPYRAMWIFFLCSAWSIAMSLCMYSIVPVWEGGLSKVVMIYRRLGVITSGKMVPGNMLSGAFHGMFAWNPLYHCIDQMRGAVFVNYTPFNSTLRYPLEATFYASCIAVFCYIGLKRFR